MLQITMIQGCSRKGVFGKGVSKDQGWECLLPLQKSRCTRAIMIMRSLVKVVVIIVGLQHTGSQNGIMCVYVQCRKNSVCGKGFR